jgi:hypothetical protein
LWLSGRGLGFFLAAMGGLLVARATPVQQAWSVFQNSSGVEALAIDDAGNVYVAGFGNSLVTQSDLLVTKYSASGQQLWQRRYDGGGTEDYA